MRTIALLLCLAACGKAGELVLEGEVKLLRERKDVPRRTDRSPVLVVAIDGMSRDLLYTMLRRGELPNLAALLGGDGFAHAHFDDTMLSTLPSTTMPAWATAFTGVTPAQHGVTGNEFFIRETRTFACPAPVSFVDSEPTLAVYTDDYLDQLIDAPTVYEQFRAREPNALIWVVMNHVHRGADALLLPRRKSLIGVFDDLAAAAITGTEPKSREVYAALDIAGIDSFVHRLKSGAIPDLATLYVYGTDLYAHAAGAGPDSARRRYLREVIDPAFAKVVARLRERGVLDRMWVMLVSDHGHTQVPHDDRHALAVADGPVRVLKSAGFRVRTAKRNVAANDPFDAVVAYGGATAYVYLADRSRCPRATDVCPWALPARTTDVLAAAEAFHRANMFGPDLRGALDMILVREPRAVAEVDRPFEVYVGDGRSVPIETYLRDHPHAAYVATAERLHDLAVGVHGERAGDLMLIAHTGDRPHTNERYYFAAKYHSWHGSPSKADSELPLIVAHRRKDGRAIGRLVRDVLGERPFQQKVTPLVLAVRAVP